MPKRVFVRGADGGLRGELSARELNATKGRDIELRAGDLVPVE